MKTLYLAKEPDAGVRNDLSRISGEVVIVDCLNAYGDYYRKIGYNCISTREFFSTKGMRFSVTIGNPPYSDRSSDSDNSANLDSLFVEKCMEISDRFKLIIRSKHFTSLSSKFRKKLFSSGKLVSIERLSDSVFPIQNTETCVISWDVNHKGPTKITYKDGTVVEKKLDKDTVIKLDNPNFVYSVDNNLSHRWVRGKLNRNKIVSGDSPMVEICGTGSEPVVSMVESGLEDTSRNTHGVVININAEWGGLGKVMIKPYEASISNSIVCLVTDTEEEAIALKNYLDSEEVKEIVKLNMPSFHPTKDLFRKIRDPLI